MSRWLGAVLLIAVALLSLCLTIDTFVMHEQANRIWQLAPPCR